MDPTFPSYLWYSNEKKNNQQNPNTNEHQLLIENKNGKIKSNTEPSTPRAEEGYCNEATQSGSSTHSHHALSMPKNIKVKQTMA
jgi:hypothetical protein